MAVAVARIRSRSVRIPTTASRSVMTTDPIWRWSISAVASDSEASAGQVTGGDDISSSTAVGMARSLGCRRDPVPRLSWLFS